MAVLVRYFGLKEVEIAEDLAQDTIVEAMEKWNHSMPHNPEGWLMDVAKKKAINFLRRSQTFETKVLPGLSNDQPDKLDNEGDSMLRMIFACCHPSIQSSSQIALALKTLCGLSIPEISSALLVNEATINKRLYRAKQKFREQAISFDFARTR